MTTKETHKLIMGRYRLYSNHEDKNLIHVLINIKSWFYTYSSFYRDGDILEQLRYVKTGRKTWNGDVLIWFCKRYQNMGDSPCVQRQYFGISKSQQNITGDMPF